MDHGVAMIHQELNPILDMSVYENIFVGRELRKNGLVDAKAEIAEAEKLIKECGLHVSPKEKLRNLTVAQCQLIEIIKAISINAKVIVMDEPTAAITDREVELLFERYPQPDGKGRCDYLHFAPYGRDLLHLRPRQRLPRWSVHRLGRY